MKLLFIILNKKNEFIDTICISDKIRGLMVDVDIMIGQFNSLALSF